MSDSTTHNLLTGTEDWSGDWQNAGYWHKSGTHDGFAVMRKNNAWQGLYKPVALTAGATYTFSAMARVPAGKRAHVYLSSGGTVNDTYLANSELPGGQESVVTGDGGWFEIHLTFTPTASKVVRARVEADDNYTIEVCAFMLVEGTTPAAWAPAEGEELTGGGAQMSANLWQAESVISSETQEGGIYACSGTRGVRTNMALDMLTSNQEFHYGFSVNPGADDSFSMAFCYRDAAGNVNYAFGEYVAVPAGKWTRVSGSAVVPSGMTVFQVVVCNNKNESGANGWKVTNPCVSYGSPVTLASGAHTPYATQDHVAAEYSTKASQKILSDSITSEVNARAKTDGAVSDLSSKMEQTVNGINVSLDKLTATERQIHSWFDFGSDASGNPKLAMGSSSSPIIGEYSNTGTTYKDRSGATLLALDAANSTTGADHVVAKDMTIGNWQWVPTNGGDNLTLVWKG